MKSIRHAILPLLLLACPACAQDVGVTEEPACFRIENPTAYTVYGTLVSDTYSAPDGTTARHHEEFKLAPKNFARFCSTGPFYPGRKLDLQLRTLIPIFECRTGTDGTITIRSATDPHGNVKTWADCL